MNGVGCARRAGERGHLRVGVVGCGQIAETAHLPNFAQLPDVDLVAVADRDRERAERCSRAFSVPSAFDSFETMLGESDLDALSICVPNKFHAPYAIAALNTGVHVLCEKPPAMTGEEAAAMAAAAQLNGKVLSFGFHYRWSVGAQTVKRFVNARDLGGIHAASAVSLRRRGIPGWRTFDDKDTQDGGPLMDIGVHVLDLALWLMGYPRPSVVLATTHRGIGSREGVGAMGAWDWRNYSVEDMVRGMICFDNGASLLLETSFAANVGEEERIQVSDGRPGRGGCSAAPHLPGAPRGPDGHYTAGEICRWHLLRAPVAGLRPLLPARRQSAGRTGRGRGAPAYRGCPVPVGQSGALRGLWSVRCIRGQSEWLMVRDAAWSKGSR